MRACPRCTFMNPMKQQACQACGTALPAAGLPTPTKHPARPTLRGLRSPAAMGAQPTPPSGADATLHSHQYTRPPPAAGVPQVAARDAVPLRGSASPAHVSRQGTLLGHSAPTAGASQTMPSMPAATSERSQLSPRIAHPVQSPQPPARPSPIALQQGEPLIVTGTAPDSAWRSLQKDHPASASPSEAVGRTLASATAPPRQVASPAMSPPLASPIATPPPSAPVATPGRATVPHRAHMPPPSMNSSHAPSSGPVAWSDPVASPLPMTPAEPSPPPAAFAEVAADLPDHNARNRRVAYAVLSLSAALLLGLLLFSVFWQPPEPIRAQVKIHDGQEVLQVHCSNCAQGSRVRLGDSQASFNDGVAILSLHNPLNVGINRLLLIVEREGWARDESIALQVPVDYRFVWDLEGLAASPPHVALDVHAAPGVQVELNGTVIALREGRGQYHLSLGDEVHGVNSSVEWLDKIVRPRVMGAGAGQAPTPLQLRLPVAPLIIDTPTSGFVTDANRIIISGRTAPGATVASGEQQAVADAHGYFEFSLPIEKRGDQQHTVEARVPDHAPRTGVVEFAQVDNLKKAAIDFQKTAVRRFDKLQHALAEEDDTQVVRVALAGRVQEWTERGAATVMVLSVSYGCRQQVCLVRVTHPSKLVLEPKQRLSVFGTAAQIVASGAGRGDHHGNLPQVQSHFLLLQ